MTITMNGNKTVGATFQTTVFMPAISISDVSLTEGDKGSKPFSFTITLSASAPGTVTLNWATANGTATGTGNGKDYTAASGTATFSAGSTSQSITVQVKGDRTRESNETFVVNLSGAVGATILDGQGVGTILNDD